MKNETAEIQNHQPEEIIRFGHTPHTEERNKKILKLLSEDKRPKEIAKDLLISISTIRWAIEWMKKNNSYHSIAALVASAIRKNLI